MNTTWEIRYIVGDHSCDLMMQVQRQATARVQYLVVNDLGKRSVSHRTVSHAHVAARTLSQHGLLRVDLSLRVDLDADHLRAVGNITLSMVVVACVASQAGSEECGKLRPSPHGGSASMCVVALYWWPRIIGHTHGVEAQSEPVVFCV